MLWVSPSYSWACFLMCSLRVPTTSGISVFAGAWRPSLQGVISPLSLNVHKETAKDRQGGVRRKGSEGIRGMNSPRSACIHLCAEATWTIWVSPGMCHPYMHPGFSFKGRDSPQVTPGPRQHPAIQLANQIPEPTVCPKFSEPACPVCFFKASLPVFL